VNTHKRKDLTFQQCKRSIIGICYCL